MIFLGVFPPPPTRGRNPVVKSEKKISPPLALSLSLDYVSDSGLFSSGFSRGKTAPLRFASAVLLPKSRSAIRNPTIAMFGFESNLFLRGPN